MFLEKLPWIEQVNIFRNVKYVVANHGAGLTNILFMNKGASVLELRNNKDKRNNGFFKLSSVVGVNYYYQLCEMVTKEWFHGSDIIVNIEELKCFLS